MGFTATTAELISSANTIDGHLGDIKGLVNAVRSEAEASSSSWKGSAHTEYADIMVRYNNAAMKLDAALTDICDQIKQSAGTFETAEGDNVNALRGATVNMG
ncbi:WXG100 family type VII secretion target [Rhodococcus sp. IEGM 1379]|uniref:WXG100 family type VII secretion target n=1 Tax=Rhodococcus sp. IEGM 1379 TaxID=3047086 RepID=UPI0024B6ECF0|nr:WXG100 family type VII secretion target [Rhodococcus sp. IEGM 1379]MDI9917919.1 WXG100 family type VII secretion target [Rhodococcus sp. IEGM 1379]